MAVTTKKLKADLQKLQDNLNRDLQTTSIKEKIIQSYHDLALKKLTALFEDEKQSRRTLHKNIETFLKENWTLINGSLLAYTALPESPLTHFICQLAQYLSQAEHHHDINTPPRPLVSLLMPTVSTDSADDHYPDLGPIWQEKKQRWVDHDLVRLLKTHILGRDGRYLIPIDRVVAIEDILHPRPSQNVYYDYTLHSDEFCYLNESDTDRLFKHSALSLSIYDKTRELNLLMEEDSSLLAHLQLLMAHLRFNSVKGVGQEMAAGEGVYEAILRFSAYYEQITSKEKQKIPPRVKRKIQSLLDYCSDKKHVGSINSCIALQRENLESAVNAHEAILLNIGIDVDSKSKLILKTKEQRRQAVAEFKAAIKVNTLTDCGDALGLKNDLLSALNLKLEFKDFDDLMLLTDFSVSDFEELYKSPEHPNKILNAIDSIENLIILCRHFSNEQLQAFLSPIKNRLFAHFFFLTKSLPMFLFNMEIGHCEIICDLFKDNISRKYRCYLISAYVNLTNELGPEKKSILYQSLKEKLHGSIQSEKDFISLLKSLTESQREELFESIKERLPDLITSGKAFSKLHNLLNEQQKAEALGLLNAQLFSKIITTGTDVAKILTHLDDRALRKKIYDLAQPKLADLIQTAEDFSIIRKRIPQKQRSNFFNENKHLIANLIKNPADFCTATSGLSTKKIRSVYQSVEEKIKPSIKNMQDYINLVEEGDQKQIEFLYKQYREKLPTFLKEPDDYQLCIQKLPLQNLQDIAYQIKTDYQDSYLTSIDNFIALLDDIKLRRLPIILSISAEKLSEIAQSKTNLMNLLKSTKSTLLPKLFPIIKHNLQSLSNKELGYLLKRINILNTQQLIVYLSNRGYLSKIIPSLSQLSKLAKGLEYNKINLLLEHYPLNSILSSPEDCATLINRCFEAQKDEKVILLSNKLNLQILSTINSVEKIAILFKHSNQRCHGRLCHIMYQVLLNHIQSREDLAQLEEHIEKTLLLDMLKKAVLSKLNEYIAQLEEEPSQFHFFDRRSSNRPSKIQAARALKDAINNTPVDLAPYSHYFTQGTLGSLCQQLIHTGIAEKLCVTNEIGNVATFIETLGHRNGV